MLNPKLACSALAFALCACIVIPTYKERITLRPVRENSEVLQLKNVLIVGTGSVAAEVFLDNLATEVATSLKSMGIRSDFSYVGRRLRKLNIDSVKQAGYDAYLVFDAANDAYLNMTKEQFVAFGPGITARGYGNQYAQRFTVALYHDSEPQQTIWEAELAVDIDLAHDGMYPRIARLVIRELVKNHVL